MLDIPITAINIISVGITFVDGRIFFKPGSKYSKVYYAICHYSEGCFALVPQDWPKGKMITTIRVDRTVGFCTHADICLDFSCELNKFNKQRYASLLGTGVYSLGLPNDLTLRSEGVILWFNKDKWKELWPTLIIQGEGGYLEFNEEEAKKIL